MTIGGGVIQHTHSSASSGGSILSTTTINDPIISNARSVRLASGIIGNQATLDFDLTPYAAYRDFEIRYSLIPVNDGISLIGRVSIDGGATFIATASYSSISQFVTDVPGIGNNGTDIDTSIRLVTPLSIGNAAAEGVHGTIDLIEPASATLWKPIWGRCANLDNAAPANFVITRAGGLYRAIDPITDFRLLFSAGNIASGRWLLSGYKV